MPADPEEDLSHLELPSLFRRKKKAKKGEPADPAPEAVAPIETTTAPPEAEQQPEPPEVEQQPSASEGAPVETTPTVEVVEPGPSAARRRPEPVEGEDVETTTTDAPAATTDLADPSTPTPEVEQQPSASEGAPVETTPTVEVVEPGPSAARRRPEPVEGEDVETTTTDAPAATTDLADPSTPTPEVEQQPSASEGAPVETTPTVEVVEPGPSAARRRPEPVEGEDVETTPTDTADTADTELIAPADDTRVLPPTEASAEDDDTPAPPEPAAPESSEPRPTLAGHFRRRRSKQRAADPAPEPTPDADPDADPAIWEPSGRAAEQPAPSEADVRRPSPLQRLADVRLPALPGHLAAAITGAVTGLVGVLLVILAQVLTEAIRGTDNAGAAGIFLVIGIIALSVAIGAAVLRAWGQTETLSMSFLGVGLVVVLVMLFLLPVIFSWVMIPVVPVLGAGTFALSWWVSNRMGPEANRINDERWPETHR